MFLSPDASDTRIRALYKDRWKHDLLRVKSGSHDYCITFEIGVLALREFQCCHCSPDHPFKPVPHGFNQDLKHVHKALPKGERA